MLMQEFTEMTGFEPTVEEYQEIELMYLNFDGSKQAFCEDFVERGEPARLYKKRAERIEELKTTIDKHDRAAKDREIWLKAKMAQIQEELDRELDWKPMDDVGTNMGQEEYEDLAKYGEVLNIVRATEIVCREFGFDRCRVEIKEEAVIYELDKYGRLRVKDKLERKPVYLSKKRNYIQFDCAGHMYEMVNGELKRYDE